MGWTCSCTRDSHREPHSLFDLNLLSHAKRCWKHFSKSFQQKRLLLYVTLCRPLMRWFLCGRSCRKVWVSHTLILFRWGSISLMHITIGLRLSLCTQSPCVSWAFLLCLRRYAKLSHQFWKFWIHQWNLVMLKAPDTVKSKVLSRKLYVINLIECYHQTKNDLYLASSLLPEAQCYITWVGCAGCSNFPTQTGTSIVRYWWYPSLIMSHPGSLNARFISSPDSGWYFGLVKMKCTHEQLPGWRNQCYLNDSSTGTSILAYWQVRFRFPTFFKYHCINKCRRKINCIIPLFSWQPWTI